MSGVIENIFKSLEKVKPKLPPGTVVRLNSTSPPMTVFPETHYKAQTGHADLPEGSVCVGWWGGAGVHLNVIPESALTIVQPAAVETEDDA